MNDYLTINEDDARSILEAEQGVGFGPGAKPHLLLRIVGKWPHLKEEFPQLPWSFYAKELHGI